VKESGNVEGNLFDMIWFLNIPTTSYTFKQETPINDNQINPTRKVQILITSKELCDSKDANFLQCEKDNKKSSDKKDAI